MKLGLVILLAVLLSSCQYDPYTHEYTTKKPLANDLVGTYVPTAKTLAYIKNEGHYPDAKMSIILSQGGTFRFNNIPDWWNTFGQSKGKFDSGSGSWSVSQNQNWWGITLHFSSTTDFNSEKKNGFVTEIMLVGERPPYLLHLTVGDPDSGDAMQFEKVEPK